MYISVFYVFYHPFSIKKIGKYVDLDAEIFFSIKSGTLYKNMTKEKKALFEPTRVQSSSSWKIFFLFLIFWVLSKNKKTDEDFSSSKK